MKQKKHSPKKAPSSDTKTGKVEDSTRSPKMMLSKRQLWLGRLFIAVFIPLFLLGGLEAGLRLAGFGYPTHFFLPTQIAKRAFYVTNEKFGFRFFTPALARTPLPLRMPVEKPANQYRIFLFGESAAQGDPDPSFGAGRYLEVLLRERYPGTDFQVVCGAMTAINSHVILPIARECAEHQGDLWIVYMGNNEMVGPFGAGTVFGQRAPSLAAVRTVLAAKTTKIGQGIEQVARNAGKASAPQAWGGMNMFRDNQLRYDDASRLRTYDNFRGNLTDMVRAGRNAGVPIILSTVASNLKDCAPFASLHSQKLTEAQKTEWENYYGEGTAFETNGDYPSALAVYAKAAALDAEFAELPFRMGRCHLALTNDSAAKKDFELARDYDALGFRADARINDIIKDVGNHGGTDVFVVDAAEVLGKASPRGISGEELFYEHVHLNFSGNYLLARAFADDVAKVLPKGIAVKQKGEWATAEFCDRRLAVSPWDRYRLWEMNFSRVSEPPFTEQLNDVPRAKMYMAKLDELRVGMNGAAVGESRAMYQAAVSATPDDHFLRENFSQFLDGVGDLPRAIEEQKQVGDLLPCFPGPFHKSGVLLMRSGNMPAAAMSFSNALALRDDYVPALNELGTMAANEGKTAEAERYFARALKFNPGYVETYFNFGFMEQMGGHMDAAMTNYQAAALIQPNGPGAYFAQAVSEAGQSHRAEAINYFHTAVYMFPVFWQAHYLMGVELAEDKRVDEARMEFEQVVRSRPDFASGHLFLGVALAKLGKLDDSLKEFRTTLQLNPTNELAPQYITQVQAAKDRRGS